MVALVKPFENLTGGLFITPVVERIQSGGSSTKSWTIRSDEDLVGRFLRIKGLESTPEARVEVQISLLGNRALVFDLTPDAPGCIIPAPVPFPSLFGQAVSAGVRRVIGRLDLWLLLIVIGPLSFKRRSLLAGLVSFTLAHSVGQALGQQSLVFVPDHAPSIAALLTVVLSALILARGGVLPRRVFRPVWLCGLFLGLLHGAANPNIGPNTNLVGVEGNLSLASFALGALVGLSLIYAVGLEARILLGSVPFLRAQDRMSKGLGYSCGCIAVCLLLQEAHALMRAPYAWTAVSPTLLLLSAALGVWLWDSAGRRVQSAYPRTGHHTGPKRGRNGPERRRQNDPAEPDRGHPRSVRRSHRD